MHVLYLTKNYHSRKYERQGKEDKRWMNREQDTEERKTGTEEGTQRNKEQEHGATNSFNVIFIMPA